MRAWHRPNQKQGRREYGREHHPHDEAPWIEPRRGHRHDEPDGEERSPGGSSEERQRLHHLPKILPMHHDATQSPPVTRAVTMNRAARVRAGSWRYAASVIHDRSSWQSVQAERAALSVTAADY